MASVPVPRPPRNKKAMAHRVSRLDRGAIREMILKWNATRGTVSTEAPRVAERVETTNQGAARR